MITTYVNPGRMGGRMIDHAPRTRVVQDALGSVFLIPAAGLTSVLDSLFPTDEKGDRAKLEEAIAEACAIQPAPPPSTGALWGAGAVGVAIGVVLGFSLYGKKKAAR